MLDLSHIPSQQQQTYTLYATGDWQTWNKPRNAKMIEIFCLGGGGGGGHSSYSGGSVAGGGGGASGGIVRGIIPAFLLPDNLYILAGKGGVGASISNSSGGNGGISYVGTQPSILDQLLVCKSSSTVAGGGGSSAAGTAPTIAGISTFSFANLGLFTAIAGVAGVPGGAAVGAQPGSSQNALGQSLITGGAGGGAKNDVTWNVGGNINSASTILTSTVRGGIALGENGANGYGTLQPFCGTGGSGGAGRTGGSGQGGTGGNGWYGCGGGGVGGGATGNSKAGNGGDGLVIITVIT